MTGYRAVSSQLEVWTGPSGGSVNSGNGGGCCVVATALTKDGIWTADQLAKLVEWATKHLDTNFFGKRLHRGYHVIGSKVFIPMLNKKNSIWSKYISWTFNNATNMLRGKKYDKKSILNSMFWVSLMTVLGFVISEEYAEKCWKQLYNKGN